MVVLRHELLVWQLEGKSGNVRAQNTYSNGSGYNLFCNTNSRFLTYKSGVSGINLGYTNSRQRKVHFRLPDRHERAILTGEPVALGIGGGRSFLKYAHRTVGINLEWSREPVYEWRIFSQGGRKGEPIPTGAWVAIVNENVEPNPDFLVYLRRSVGADIGWTTSPNSLTHLIDRVRTEVINAASDWLSEEISN